MHKDVRTAIREEIDTICTQSDITLAQAKAAVQTATVGRIVDLMQASPEFADDIGGVTIDDIAKEIDWLFIDKMNVLSRQECPA
jgi:hypothetical protein